MESYFKIQLKMFALPFLVVAAFLQIKPALNMG